jgi:hypothetical protein
MYRIIIPVLFQFSDAWRQPFLFPVTGYNSAIGHEKKLPDH